MSTGCWSASSSRAAPWSRAPQAGSWGARRRAAAPGYAAVLAFESPTPSPGLALRRGPGARRPRREGGRRPAWERGIPVELAGVDVIRLEPDDEVSLRALERSPDRIERGGRSGRPACSIPAWPPSSAGLDLRRDPLDDARLGELHLACRARSRAPGVGGLDRVAGPGAQVDVALRRRRRGADDQQVRCPPAGRRPWRRARRRGSWPSARAASSPSSSGRTPMLLISMRPGSASRRARWRPRRGRRSASAVRRCRA